MHPGLIVAIKVTAISGGLMEQIMSQNERG